MVASSFIVGANNSLYSTVPIIALNDTVNDMICGTSETRRTKIKFVKSSIDVPAVSFYANKLTGGSIYFQVIEITITMPLKIMDSLYEHKTEQILQCNCVSYGCNGTFRVSFDGEMSDRLYTWKNVTQIKVALEAMKTFQSTVISADLLI
jgi:hypothetical protein